MNTFRIILTLLLGSVICGAFAGRASAQDYDVLVTPAEAELEVGEAIQLETYAYLATANGETLEIDSTYWEMDPDSMGTITDDGFFIAGRAVGVIHIKGTFFIGDRRIVKRIVIRIGEIAPRPLYDLKVLPEHAIVPAGGEQQFRVQFLSRIATNIRYNIRWEVLPGDPNMELGKIDENGLFSAGRQEGYGKVVAYVDIAGVTFRAAARVTVGPAATGAIAGNVISDEDASPLQGASITAYRLGRIDWVKRTETDSEGNYFLGDLVPGNYVLHANKRGYLGEYYDNTRKYNEAFILQIADKDTLADKDFGLSEGASISGNVHADLDNAPLEKAHVAVSLFENRRFARNVLTDANGNYIVESLPQGAYVLRTNKSGYRAEYYDDKPNRSEADIINLGDEQDLTGVDVGLATASAISGKVVSAVNSEPIARATIHVFTGISAADLSNTRVDLAFHRRIFRETHTNSEGEYIIQVPPGSYYVLANAPGFNSEFYDNAREFESATVVKVSEDSHASGIDFDLVPRGSISGLVTDRETGAAIADAVVEAFNERMVLDRNTAALGLRATTDESGHYTIENVPDGAYIVVANAREYLAEYYKEAPSKQEATLVEVDNSAIVGDIDFTLDMGGTISGLVASEEDSLPIGGALVQAYEKNSGLHRRTQTANDGSYQITGLRTGDYYVFAAAEDFQPEFFENARHRGEATLVKVESPGETAGIDMYLDPVENRRGTITGRITSDTDAEPLGGSVVVAVSAKHRIPFITFSGPRGHYNLTGLPATSYYVFAWSPGYIGEFFDDAKRFKNAEPVAVEEGQITAGIDFGLEPVPRRGGYVIRGKIRARSDDRPLHGILVHARLDSDVEVSAVTDFNGDYIIEGVPAGRYKIEATGAGYTDSYFGGENIEEANDVEVGNLQDAPEIVLSMGEDNITSVGSTTADLPESYSLDQNFPNPFNPETTIKYQIAEVSEVTLKVYNMIGQEVATLVRSQHTPGSYTVQWNGRDDFGRPVASGLYVFKLSAGEKFSTSRRMLLLK
jgi:hypothetical protein